MSGDLPKFSRTKEWGADDESENSDRKDHRKQAKVETEEPKRRPEKEETEEDKMIKLKALMNQTRKLLQSTYSSKTKRALSNL